MEAILCNTLLQQYIEDVPEIVPWSEFSVFTPILNSRRIKISNAECMRARPIGLLNVKYRSSVGIRRIR
jgi:hypothetical protein